MLFNSLHFLVFLPVVVTLYFLLAQQYRWILIFIASCYFYMAFVPKYILILFLLIGIDFLAGLLIEKASGRRRLFYLVTSLSANILLLGFFKYFLFVNESLQDVFSIFGAEFQPVSLNVILPIGLSFHTFQSMSYTIEVYRGKQKAEKHLGYFANYVLFFPQMVAGPIERYSTLGAELKKRQQPEYSNFVTGLRLILFGLFIKMTIADNIAPYVNEIYEDPLRYNSVEVLSAVFLFSFQIYADFFGYSTIALGSAKLLGINIIDNFKTPYLSRSVGEFWSRWHISLSTWFRDYLYIPLGGNRVSLLKWTFNILIVFIVSGLWHGAGWTFVFWGALHGLMLLMEKYFSKLFNFQIKSEKFSILNLLLIVKTFFITSLIWIFFRATSFENAKNVFKAIIRNSNVEFSNLNFLFPVVCGVGMLFLDVFLYKSRFDLRLRALRTPYRWAIYTVLIFCLFALSGAQKFTFIYFQF